jgi:hypothetical protein
VVLASAYAVIVGGAAALLFLLLPDSEAQEDGPPPVSVPFSLAPECHGAACEGRDPMRLICGIGPETGALGDGGGGGGGELPSPGVSWPILQSGSEGADVRSAQQLLAAQGYTPEADGIFGPDTRSAVIQFQRSRSLAADGVIGPNTWLCPPSSPVVRRS